MSEKYYIQLDHDNYKKVKQFCDENNIDRRESSEIFSFVAEHVVDAIEKEDNIKLKDLFSECENNEYEYDIMCNHIEETVIHVLDDNFSVLKEQFYDKIKFRKELKGE